MTYKWEVTIKTPEGSKKYVAEDTVQNILIRIRTYLLNKKNDYAK